MGHLLHIVSARQQCAHGRFASQVRQWFSFKKCIYQSLQTPLGGMQCLHVMRMCPTHDVHCLQHLKYVICAVYVYMYPVVFLKPLKQKMIFLYIHHCFNRSQIVVFEHYRCRPKLFCKKTTKQRREGKVTLAAITMSTARSSVCSGAHTWLCVTQNEAWHISVTVVYPYQWSSLYLI